MGVFADHSYHCHVITGMEVDSTLGGDVEINCDPVLVTVRSQQIRHGGPAVVEAFKKKKVMRSVRS